MHKKKFTTLIEMTQLFDITAENIELFGA